eukprot:704356-Rhodomonas_salina.1
MLPNGHETDAKSSRSGSDTAVRPYGNRVREQAYVGRWNCSTKSDGGWLLKYNSIASKPGLVSGTKLFSTVGIPIPRSARRAKSREARRASLEVTAEMRLRSAASHEGAKSEPHAEYRQLRSGTANSKSHSTRKVKIKLLCCCSRSSLWRVDWMLSWNRCFMQPVHEKSRSLQDAN